MLLNLTILYKKKYTLYFKINTQCYLGITLEYQDLDENCERSHQWTL